MPRIGIKLVCDKCKSSNYFSDKNKTVTKTKIITKKFCKNCHSIQIHKEKWNK